MAKLRMRFDPFAPDGAEQTISELSDRYEAWHRASHPGVAGVDVSDLQLLMDWKVNYGDGRLDEWSQSEVAEFLLGWCPRKLSISARDARGMPARIAAAFSFLSDAKLLAARSEPGPQLAAHANSLAREFRARMSDPSNFGMAKSLLGGHMSDAPAEQSSLERLLSQLETQPRSRAQLIAALEAMADSPGDPSAVDEADFDDDDFDDDSEAGMPTFGPVVLPDEDAVRACAAAAPVLAGFTALSDFFGPTGRPLTAKGNIRLADAKAISEILGTETLEQAVGELTFNVRTSTELPGLDHWQWWAREAGVLRVRHGRLIAVQAWRTRCRKDPVAEARKAVEILLGHGAVASYAPHVARWVDGVVDLMVGPLLGLLVARTAPPVEFTDLVAMLQDARAAVGYAKDRDAPHYLVQAEAEAIDVMLTLLERAAVVVQHNPSYTDTEYSQCRSGGTVEITPFGVTVAVAVANSYGARVITISNPEQLTAADLAALVVEFEDDGPGWQRFLLRWLDLQPDRHEALRDVLEHFPASTGLLVALTPPTPPEIDDDLAAIFGRFIKTRPHHDFLAAMGLMWLVDHDRLAVADLDPRAAMTAHLVALGALSALDPEAGVEAFSTQGSRNEQLAMMTAAGRLATAEIEALLAAIGAHHPDKTIAKTARKEVLRVRSRRASLARDNP